MAGDTLVGVCTVVDARDATPRSAPSPPELEAARDVTAARADVEVVDAEGDCVELVDVEVIDAEVDGDTAPLAGCLGDDGVAEVLGLWSSSRVVGFAVTVDTVPSRPVVVAAELVAGNISPSPVVLTQE